MAIGSHVLVEYFSGQWLEGTVLAVDNWPINMVQVYVYSNKSCSWFDEERVVSIHG